MKFSYVAAAIWGVTTALCGVSFVHLKYWPILFTTGLWVWAARREEREKKPMNCKHCSELEGELKAAQAELVQARKNQEYVVASNNRLAAELERTKSELDAAQARIYSLESSQS
jgi:hypothetical protein